MFGIGQSDPTGVSRELYQNVFNNVDRLCSAGKFEKAKELATRFGNVQRDKYGSSHADVGRACLLLTTIAIIEEDFVHAQQCCDAALLNLQNARGEDDPDYIAAAELEKAIQKALTEQ